MSLRFRDKKGYRGTVTESLEVEYSGQWEEEVSEAVEAAEEDDPDDVMTELLIELPEKAPLTEVRKDEASV